MEKNIQSLKIGETAKQSKLSIHTIRYYEKEGLLKGPARSEGGFRLYSNESVDQLVFIKKAQELGLTLREIKKIMVCGKQGLEPCCDLTVDLFTGKIKEFESKIKELQQMKKRLNLILSKWVGRKTSSQCC